MFTALFLVACGVNNSAPAAPTAPPQQASGPRVIFPDNFAVQVEIAADDATRTQGLMYRDQLANDRGMIFLFAQSGDYPFWMKNTLIPLDMIWIDDQKKIVHVAHDVPPCKADPCPSYPPGANSRYVLEVAAGVAARHNLANGQTLRFEGLDTVVVR
ncbi:MAG TPA: DUF192 domain-containing protein [Thermoanaerobaculia bacterium]|nr:DUF192 domain-containing protein [Thermoanaerobaculia bacterium]